VFSPLPFFFPLVFFCHRSQAKSISRSFFGTAGIFFFLNFHRGFFQTLFPQGGEAQPIPRYAFRGSVAAPSYPIFTALAIGAGPLRKDFVCVVLFFLSFGQIVDFQHDPIAILALSSFGCKAGPKHFEGKFPPF